MIVYSLNYKNQPIYIGVGKYRDRPYEHLDYVSSKSKRLLRRISKDKSLYEYIEKVGVGNIKVIYLLESDDEDLCYMLEETLHRDLGLRCDNNGILFGLRYGRKLSNYMLDKYYRGDSNKFYGKSHTEETKRIVGEKASKRMKGKHLPKEWRESLSKAKSGSNHPMYGNHHTDESKRKISEGLRNNPEHTKKLRGLKSARTRFYINKGKPVPKELQDKIDYWENIESKCEQRL